jgi:predicted RNA binding protein YcfA (HicA-like mRNA interferase family)
MEPALLAGRLRPVVEHSGHLPPRSVLWGRSRRLFGEQNPRLPRETRIAVHRDARQHGGTLTTEKLVPPKIRELIAELQNAGFVDRGGRGSHRNYVHPRIRKPVTISGDLGDDAKPYQVRAVWLAIRGSQQ